MTSPRPSPAPSTVQDCWDCMLPGPPSRNNFGSVDVSPSGLLAFPAGSSISVIDTRSMQLVVSLPMPPPTQSQSQSSSSATSSLSPFVTSVRWTPLPSRPRPPNHRAFLLLAAGDRQGRVALIDLRLKTPVLWFDSDNSSRLAIQDLCWVQARPDSYLLAAISGFSSLSLFSSSTGRCFWKYDAAPEILSCIRRDPFDSRHFCVVGLKGFLLSVTVLGETEDEVVINELQIQTECKELLKLERELAGGGGAGVSGGSSSSASAAFPLYVARFAFSPQLRHILFVTFPRELVVFDLQYETQLFSAALPRGCGKFLDVLPDPNSEFLYCSHVDGRLSTWRRKEGEQVHIMCSMEELMPSIGTTVPSPSVLALSLSQSDSTLQNIGKLYSDEPDSPFSSLDFDNPFDFCDEHLVRSKTHLISISDDGKVWNWLLTAEGPEDIQREDKKLDVVSKFTEVPVAGTGTNTVVSSSGGVEMEASKESEQSNGDRSRPSRSTVSHTEISLKISLVGQLQLLSSAVTMLAVPLPSSTATLGLNYL